jgi:hypothetical protein
MLYLIPDVSVPKRPSRRRAPTRMDAGRFLERLRGMRKPFSVFVGGYEEIFQQAIRKVNGLLKARGVRLPNGGIVGE